MKTIHKEAVLKDDGILTIHDLPLKKGQKVNIQIHSLEENKSSKKYPLRGLPFKLSQPFDSVSENDWNVLK